eukprot:748176-Hanusia_phi.AAC.4
MSKLYDLGGSMNFRHPSPTDSLPEGDDPAAVRYLRVPCDLLLTGWQVLKRAGIWVYRGRIAQAMQELEVLEGRPAQAMSGHYKCSELTSHCHRHNLLDFIYSFPSVESSLFSFTTLESLSPNPHLPSLDSPLSLLSVLPSTLPSLIPPLSSCLLPALDLRRIAGHELDLSSHVVTRQARRRRLPFQQEGRRTFERSLLPLGLLTVSRSRRGGYRTGRWRGGSSLGWADQVRGRHDERDEMGRRPISRRSSLLSISRRSCCGTCEVGGGEDKLPQRFLLRLIENVRQVVLAPAVCHEPGDQTPPPAQQVRRRRRSSHSSARHHHQHQHQHRHQSNSGTKTGNEVKEDRARGRHALIQEIQGKQGHVPTSAWKLSGRMTGCQACSSKPQSYSSVT